MHTSQFTDSKPVAEAVAPDHRQRQRVRTLLLTLGATVALVAACSSTPGASAPTNASPSAGSIQDLAVTGKEYAFEAPAAVPAGPTRITLTNAGKEEHQVQVAKLADGKTFADLTEALKGPNESAALALVSLDGGPTGVVPGASGSTTVALTPGQYVFLCFVTTAEGVPHFAKGMIAPLEVKEPASTAALPAGDAALTLQDFAFVGLDTLSPGKHAIAITNKGPQPHEATIVKLADGVTVPQLLTAFTSNEPPAGPPPFTSAGGIAGVAPGASATLDVDLPAGNYAYICFVPDPATGKPHAALGMIGALTVK